MPNSNWSSSGQWMGPGQPGVADSFDHAFSTPSSAFDMSYHFGDFLTGAGAARQQAAAQMEMQYQQQQFNSAEAEKDRQWQQAMRDSSISSAFEQYKDVGVNPYLAVMQGSQGVTSAGGSTASSGQGSVSKATQNLTGMMASAAGVGLALAKIIKALK